MRHNRQSEYFQEETVRDGDRERERAVRNSDGRFYHV